MECSHSTLKLGLLIDGAETEPLQRRGQNILAIKRLKIHSPQGERMARHLNNPEKTLTILYKHHVTLGRCK